MKAPWDVLDIYRGKQFDGEWPTIPQLFSITLSRLGDKRAFSQFEPEPFSLTYREIEGYVSRVKNHLLKLGVKKGDKIALTGKNSVEWAVAYLSILFSGAVVVPLDYQLKTEELEKLIRFSDSRVLFVDEERYDSLGGEKTAPGAVISLSKTKPDYILDLEGGTDIEAAMPAASMPAASMPKEDDIAAVLFTSGTTGNEKGVMLSHRNLISDTFYAQANLTILTDDVFYAILPIHHSYTMTAVLLEALSVGAEVVFGKRLATPQIMKELKEGNITMLLGVPMLFNKMLKGIIRGIREKGVLFYGLIRAMMKVSGLIKKVFKVNPGKKMFGFILKRASLENIRICISGAGPLPPSTFRQFNQLGIDFIQGYGLTETSPIVTLNPKEHYKETSVGKVLPNIDIRILDPDENGVGEVLAKGQVVMQGYYKNSEATKEVFTEDGYLMTGDVGYLDDDGYLYLTGRKKSMIVTEGGKNVYPEEIENAFQLYDEIEQILVKGYVKDEKSRAENIEAYVYPSIEYFGEKARNDIPEEGRGGYVTERIGEIIAEVNLHLKPYQRISRFKLLAEPLEMTTTKKIKRYKIALGAENE
ncbi:MAG: AMP-binding protein [Spirochaetes bacterium]|nr:AMP-binding protein [Spirochaetota bacterium]